jgi:internalin A
MSGDTAILASINELLATEANELGREPRTLVPMPLSLILPVGSLGGVALDANGDIVGIKLGGIGRAGPAIIAKICELKRLKRLVFFCQESLDIPQEIRELKRLEAIWFGGSLKSLPESLLDFDLPILGDANFKDVASKRALEITDQLVGDRIERPKNDEVTSVEGLTEGDLVKKRLLTASISEDLLSLKGIFLSLHQLEDPPLEIANKGRDAITRYFQERSQGYLPLNELKIILVGNGGSGKTSLVKRLVGEQFDPKERQTHGINIRQWMVDTPTREVKLHFWDFGGQEIMHATHQFFLSKRSMYILVLDGRRDEDPEYWLQHIESFGGDSPVLLVLNRIDEHPAFDVNRRFLKNKYKGIVDFFRVSCATNLGVREVIEHLGNELDKVPMLRTRWPQSWFRVKQELSSLDAPYLSLEQFRLLCDRERVSDSANQELLVDFLHDLGVVLHFKDIELLDTHVLDPRWVTDGAYRIINSEIVAKQKGLLPLNQISKILAPQGQESEYPADKHRYIVDLMLKFELCYRIGDRAILIPDLLDIQEPTLDFDEEDALYFVFEFGYLPKSIMPRFIVRMHGDIRRAMRWRTGVLLEDKTLDARALVRADEKAKRIYIIVGGQQRRDYFAVIKKVLRDIVSSFEKLLVTELVPLPDKSDVLLDYRELLGHEAAKKEEIFVGRLSKSFNVQTLLNGIEKPAVREAQIVVNVQGNYYAGQSITSHSTQVAVNESRGRNMAYIAKAWERAIVYLSGAAFLALVGYLLIRNEPFADPNLVVVLRIVLSLVMAIFGATIPGMLKVDFSAKGLTIRAAGALALVVIAYLLTPTVLPR